MPEELAVAQLVRPEVAFRVLVAPPLPVFGGYRVDDVVRPQSQCAISPSATVAANLPNQLASLDLQTVGLALHVLEHKGAVAWEGRPKVPGGCVRLELPKLLAVLGVQTPHHRAETPLCGIRCNDHHIIHNAGEAVILRDLSGNLGLPEEVAILNVQGKSEPIASNSEQGTVVQPVRVHAAAGMPSSVLPQDLPVGAKLPHSIGPRQVYVALVVDDRPIGECPKPAPWVRPVPSKRPLAQLEGGRVLAGPAVRVGLPTPGRMVVIDLQRECLLRFLRIVVFHVRKRGSLRQIREDNSNEDHSRCAAANPLREPHRRSQAPRWDGGRSRERGLGPED
mmetsp:Transcript_84148/g.223417  ORF Transcript_84148/g.223417 Transcript_84148/m.223417 type:complete len:336 (+) Transcript_84148:631-1638(+)